MASSWRTQIPAVTACYFMRRYGYKPRSVINVGVGKSSPELDIWKWLLPGVSIIGIDPRGRHKNWDVSYVQAVVTDGSDPNATFCGKCLSIKCTRAKDHGRMHHVRTVTLDEICESVPGPYFLWMDCEGSELDALRGGTTMLKKTGWISLEIREHEWDPDYPNKLHATLAECGFKLWFDNPMVLDKLYRRMRKKRR